ILELLQHGDLVIRGETGQHPGGVQVIEELAAHLQVQLATDLLAPLVDVLRLHPDVEVTVESGAHCVYSPVGSACYLDASTLPLSPSTRTSAHGVRSGRAQGA